MSKKKSIAIVGGGITGLYCAYILKKNGHDVYLFEETKRVGGRIRTVRLDDEGKAIASEQFTDKARKNPFSELAFHAEFGPMRVAPFEHRLLQRLLRKLGFGDPQDLRVTGRKVGKGAEIRHLEDFPRYSSPVDNRAPKYDLRPDEAGKDPLELLQLALRRVMVRISLFDLAEQRNVEGEVAESFAQWKRELVENLSLAEEIGDDPATQFLASVRRLQQMPQVIWAIQTHGVVDFYVDQTVSTRHSRRGANETTQQALEGRDFKERIPLYTLGFWNLISGFLSHDAVEEVRNIGTFYHLMPDNPNAAEWLAWWLSGLAISDRLKGFRAGTEILPEQLKKRLVARRRSEEEGKCLIFPQHRVLSIERARKGGGGAVLKVRLSGSLGTSEGFVDIPRSADRGLVNSEASLRKSRSDASSFDHVLVALPRSPLEKVLLQSTDALSLPVPIIEELLDSAYGFPLVKVFFMVRRRWWEENSKPNESAGRVPTREIHRFESKVRESRRGVVMLYTDRPASAFWGNFVPSGRHVDVLEWRRDKDGNAPRDESQQWSRLRKKIVRYFRQFAGDTFREEDILWMGIRDWSRDPYAGGNHAWRPKRRYWHVMKELAGLKLKAGKTGESETARIHVCGEAYSDYHGFMEGSLRSAVYVLSKILGGPSKFDPSEGLPEGETRLTWLRDTGLAPRNGADYLDKWIEALDEDKGGLYHWNKDKDNALRDMSE